MVNVFKSIGSGETVSLEVCRGYPLPFDPNDPNTEVVTTIAVSEPGDMMPRIHPPIHHHQQSQQQQQQQLHPMSQDPSLYMDLDHGIDQRQQQQQQSDPRFNFLDSSFLPVHNLQNGDTLANTSVNSMPDLCISDKINTIKRPSSTDILLSEMVDSSDNKNPSTPPSPQLPQVLLGKPEFLSISIVKGIDGFGFTIADSSHGQKVKKIIDRPRCKNLTEGDILVNINEVNVRNMCHSEVVQVLKDCPIDREALIHVQRTTTISTTTTSTAATTLTTPTTSATPTTITNSGNKSKDNKGPQYFFRSKTPTADIYSTQAKTAVPSRPKTPVIDTRNRTKSPNDLTGHRNEYWNERSNEMTDLNPLDSRYKYADYNRGMYYTDPYKANIGNLTENFGPMTNLDDDTGRHGGGGIGENRSNEMYPINVGHHHDNLNKHSNGGSIHSDYYKDIYASQSQSQMQLQSQYAEQDYSPYTMGQEQNVDTGEIWDKRKETTSFEHEQPRSSSVSR